MGRKDAGARFPFPPPCPGMCKVEWRVGGSEATSLLSSCWLHTAQQAPHIEEEEEEKEEEEKGRHTATLASPWHEMTTV